MDTSNDPSVVLAQWEADEKSRRELFAAPGVARPAQVQGKTGLEFAEAMFAGELPGPAIGATLAFLPIEVTHGRAVFQGRPMLAHYNPLGTRARRLDRHAARLVRRLRGALHAVGRQGLHDGRVEGQLRACRDHPSAAGARHRNGDPRRWPHGHRRRPPRRPRRKAVRSRIDHLFHLRCPVRP